MAELERGRGQEEHPLETALQRPRELARVVGSRLIDEERGESRRRVLQVVGFVEDEQR